MMLVDIAFKATGKHRNGGRIAGTIVARCLVDPEAAGWPAQKWDGFPAGQYGPDESDPRLEFGAALAVTRPVKNEATTLENIVGGYETPCAAQPHRPPIGEQLGTRSPFANQAAPAIDHAAVLKRLERVYHAAMRGEPINDLEIENSLQRKNLEEFRQRIEDLEAQLNENRTVREELGRDLDFRRAAYNEAESQRRKLEVKLNETERQLSLSRQHLGAATREREEMRVAMGIAQKERDEHRAARESYLDLEKRYLNAVEEKHKLAAALESIRETATV